MVYVDNDPVVRTHAEALLTSTTGPCVFIEAGVRDPPPHHLGPAMTLDLRVIADGVNTDPAGNWCFAVV